MQDVSTVCKLSCVLDAVGDAQFWHLCLDAVVSHPRSDDEVCLVPARIATGNAMLDEGVHRRSTDPSIFFLHPEALVPARGRPLGFFFW